MSFNANGIRAITRKGFWDWFHTQNIDVLCIQETKAQLEQLGSEILEQEGYSCYFSDAVKKGYSGTAIFTKQTPKTIHYKLGFDISDSEGRWIAAEYDKTIIASLYLPSGSSSKEAQAKKDTFLNTFMPMMKAWRDEGKSMIICGDWNIVHKEIDIKNWKGNQKNSGCLPHERAWLDELFDAERADWVDAFREVNQEAEQYTWWSNRGQAWINNTGWRIDYHVVTPDLKDKILKEEVYRQKRLSDHAPLTLEYDITL